MKSLNRVISIAVLLSFAVFISACEKKVSAQVEPDQVQKVGEHQQKIDKKDQKKSDSYVDDKTVNAVNISKSGTKFEPSIKPKELPDGVWACKMDGKVHYARSEKGDGKCEICKMALSEHKSKIKTLDGENKQPEKHGHGDHEHKH